MGKGYERALETFHILFSERMGYDKTNLQQERRNAFEKGYEASVEDVVEWLTKHINDYLVKGRDIDLMFDDIRVEFGLEPKYR